MFAKDALCYYLCGGHLVSYIYNSFCYYFFLAAAKLRLIILKMLFSYLLYS